MRSATKNHPFCLPLSSRAMMGLAPLLAVLIGFAAGCSEKHPSWTTSTGLKVTEVVEGEGEAPSQGDVVSVLYTAWYVEGNKEIVSVLDPESPHKFRLGRGGVLKGLDEGVASMRPGGKRILILPPELAFEAEDRPNIVPPGSWVRFEVELIEVEPGIPDPLPWNDAGLDIVVTNSGLQYVDFEVGEGPHPTVGGTIQLYYTGFLDDGTIFDTTAFRTTPIQLDINAEELIPGWLEGVLSMKPGGQRKLIIPPHLGYGEKGLGKKVPPNATLTFDITLIAAWNSQ